MVKVWNDLYSLTEKYTDGWLSSGMFISACFLVVYLSTEKIT
jgi:hypothetical protein